MTVGGTTRRSGTYLGFAFLGMVLTGCSSSRVILAGEDVVSLPDRAVEVRVKAMERTIFLKDIERRKIEFKVLRTPADVPPSEVRLKVADQGVTDDEGEAMATIRVPRPGFYEIGAWFRGDDRYLPQESTVVILAIEPHQPVLVLDVDNTLTDENWLRAKPEPGPYDNHTVRVVNALSKRYAIVYLTARPRPLHQRTQNWLHKHGFPAGPVLLWYPEKFSWLRPVRYKRDILLEMQRAGLNLAVGVGNTTGDIKAYRRAGLVPIILGKKLWYADSVDNWAQIETILMTKTPASPPAGTP